MGRLEIIQSCCKYKQECRRRRRVPGTRQQRPPARVLTQIRWSNIRCVLSLATSARRGYRVAFCALARCRGRPSFSFLGGGRPGRRAERRGHGGVDGDAENTRMPPREAGRGHRQRHHPRGAMFTLRGLSGVICLGLAHR